MELIFGNEYNWIGFELLEIEDIYSTLNHFLKGINLILL